MPVSTIEKHQRYLNERKFFCRTRASKFTQKIDNNT